MGVIRGQLKKLDWGLLGASIVLVVFSLLGIYSTCVAHDDFSNFYKQAIFFVVGLVLMFLISFFDYRMLRNNSYLILGLYILCLILLAGTLFFGPQIKGSNRWYRLGPISLDPIEPAKLVLIILLAKYFSMRHVEMYKMRHILVSGFYALLMAGLVFLRPNLGGAMILTIVWVGILLISGIKLRHFLLLLLCFAIVAVFAWQFLLDPYQKGRVTAFIFPYDYYGASWSQNQTKISIGSGQIFGQGLAKGSQVQYGFLPEPHTDFIFSVIAEEWGIVGVVVLFFTYGFLLWSVLRIAIESQSNFPRLFASGFVIVLITQFFLNIGMNLSLLPVVGIYLPFVSYGGSGLIGNFISLGILQSIKMRK